MGLWCMTLECYFKNVSISTVYSKVAPVELDFQLMISFWQLLSLKLAISWNLVTLDQLKVPFPHTIQRCNFPDPYSYAGIILCQTGPPPKTLLARPKSGSNIFFESQWPKTSDLLLYVVYDCIQSSFEGLKLKGFDWKVQKLDQECVLEVFCDRSKCV